MIPTRLSRFFSGVMEAVWLAAVVIIPLFFNIYSSRIFEPDKIAILRSLALLTLFAWFLKVIEEGGTGWRLHSKETSLVKYLVKFPMVTPVFALILVYIISTIFSVTPSISIFGSYQRLQGTYTTLSYLIIFGSLVINLRSRNQINRLITVIILTSLPVSLYGLLQRYQIDPIPWGGNVSVRIASTLGNSIFVASYLIMVFPLTLGRTMNSFREILRDDDSGRSTGSGTGKLIIKATIYVFIAAIELIAIYMSGSRGPMLGLLAGLYLFILLFSIYWNKRWITVAVVGIAVIGAAFLAVFNISNGPLEGLKKSPAIGRFGMLLDTQSNSALVRQYIWEGTVDLVGIHEPLQFPDGSSDRFNFLRPLVGYGPESMYVAYNQFYQPELGQVERRNASPDRSHNETWDSIVITGILGLLIYLSIFSLIFYYGVKWLGLIKDKRNRLFFFMCLITGGFGVTFVLTILKGLEFLGVGLPFGMVLGVVLYLTVYALFSKQGSNGTSTRNSSGWILIPIFAAIIGHFIEINFGIAIVSTRTLFWTYAGVMIVVGFLKPQIDFDDRSNMGDLEVDNLSKTENITKRGKYIGQKNRRKGSQMVYSAVYTIPAWIRSALIGGGLVGLILTVLGYDLINNSLQSTSLLEVILNSFTRLPNKENAVSFGILALFLLTWMIGVLFVSVEFPAMDKNAPWVLSLTLTAAASLAIAMLFWILHAVSLVNLTNQDAITALLTKLYLYFFIIVIFLALFLPDEFPQRRFSKSVMTVFASVIGLVIFIPLIGVSNLKVSHADMNFKIAEPYTKNGRWDVASALYKSAIKMAPREDHYYLFLGRSYLEQAKATEAVSEQDSLVKQAETDLKKAQSINPLNTDHTANLARLYSWWAGQAPSVTVRNERAQQASEYYATSITLSPYNSTLWGEWAVLFMQVMGQEQEAFTRLQHALELDTRYSFTQGLMGDFYMRRASGTTVRDEKVEALEIAASYYLEAAEVTRRIDTTSKGTYLITAANVYSILANIDAPNIDRTHLQTGIDILVESLEVGLSENDQWRVQEAISKLYLQLSDKQMAQYYASQALSTAPDSAASRIQQLMTQIDALP